MSATLFCQLVLSLEGFEKQPEPKLRGSLSALDSTLNLLNAMVEINPELLTMRINGQTLDQALMPCVRAHMSFEHNVYLCDHSRKTLDDWIEQVWLPMSSDADDFYCGNGAYIMSGISSIILKNLIKGARKANARI